MLDEVEYRSLLNEALDGQTFCQAGRSNNGAPFCIVEDIIDNIILEEVEKLPFFDSFVEVKNRIVEDTVDTTEWRSGKDSILSTACFAGNHYDVNCVNIKAEEFTMPREWVYFDIFEDIERFLLGDLSFDKVKDRIFKAIAKYIESRIHMNFQTMLEYSCDPRSQSWGILSFKNDGQNLESLCDTVKKHSECNKCTIAGTRVALRKFGNIVPEELKCDVFEWNGNKIIVIPTETNDRRFGDKLLIFGDAECDKPIKFEFIGDTRVRFGWFLDSTSDIMAQTCLSVGVLVPNGYGVFTFDE